MFIDTLFAPKYCTDSKEVKYVDSDGEIHVSTFGAVKNAIMVKAVKDAITVKDDYNVAEKRCIDAIRKGLGSGYSDKDIAEMSYHVSKKTWWNTTGKPLNVIIGTLYAKRGLTTIEAMEGALRTIGEIERGYLEYRKSDAIFKDHVEPILKSDLDIYESGFSVWVRISGFRSESEFKEFVYKNRANVIKYIKEDMTRGKRPLVNLIGDFKYYAPKQITLTKDRCAVVHFDIKPEVESILSKCQK